VELELTSMEGASESGDELAAEDATEHADGKEKGTPGGDPACVVRSDTAGGNYAVDMRMKLQALISAMEHAEETYLSCKVAWIAGNLQQGLGTCVKEQVIDEPLVLQCEGGKFPRQREDGVHIASGQQSPLARLEPAHARVALTLGTVPVAARNGAHTITCLMGSFLLWGVRRASG